MGDLGVGKAFGSVNSKEDQQRKKDTSLAVDDILSNVGLYLPVALMVITFLYTSELTKNGGVDCFNQDGQDWTSMGYMNNYCWESLEAYNQSKHFEDINNKGYSSDKGYAHDPPTKNLTYHRLFPFALLSCVLINYIPGLFWSIMNVEGTIKAQVDYLELALEEGLQLTLRYMVSLVQEELESEINEDELDTVRNRLLNHKKKRLAEKFTPKEIKKEEKSEDDEPGFFKKLSQKAKAGIKELEDGIENNTGASIWTKPEEGGDPLLKVLQPKKEADKSPDKTDDDEASEAEPEEEEIVWEGPAFKDSTTKFQIFEQYMAIQERQTSVIRKYYYKRIFSIISLLMVSYGMWEIYAKDGTEDFYCLVKFSVINEQNNIFPNGVERLAECTLRGVPIRLLCINGLVGINILAVFYALFLWYKENKKVRKSTQDFHELCEIAIDFKEVKAIQRKRPWYSPFRASDLDFLTDMTLRNSGREKTPVYMVCKLALQNSRATKNKDEIVGKKQDKREDIELKQKERVRDNDYFRFLYTLVSMGLDTEEDVNDLAVRATDI